MWRILFYAAARSLAISVMLLLYRCRAYEAHRVPRIGPVLLAANHQSYLDPPLVGGFCGSRHASFVARAGLFAAGWFGGLLRLLNSIPIEEAGGDARAIKETLRRLALGHAVVIFPEGSRSPDGAMRKFKRGVALLMKKSSCPVVPVAVEGCFDAWPRGSAPRVFGRRIAVMYGDPIPHDELLKDGPDAALRRLEREIDAMRLVLRERLRERTAGRCPEAGPADGPFTASA